MIDILLVNSIVDVAVVLSLVDNISSKSLFAKDETFLFDLHQTVVVMSDHELLDEVLVFQNVIL